MLPSSYPKMPVHLTVIRRIASSTGIFADNFRHQVIREEIVKTNKKEIAKRRIVKTFSGAYTHFESFLPATYKFGMVYTLAYRCFRICSDWTKFNEELRFLKGVFLKNGYPSGFIDFCFKKVVDNVLTESPVKLTVEKRFLILPIPFLGDISLQLRAKLRK